MIAFPTLAAATPSMEGFADIDGPVYASWHIWAILATALLSLLLAAAFLYFRRRAATAKTLSSPPPPPEPPLQRALRRLDQLESERDHWSADPLTVATSDVVRSYLAEVLRIPASQQTSDEFLAALNQQPDRPAILQQHLPDFLRQCDFIKFARGRLDPSQRDHLLQSARHLVHQTDQALQPVATNPPDPIAPAQP